MKRILCASLAIAALLLPPSAAAGPRPGRVLAEVAAADSIRAAFGVIYGTLGNTPPNSGALIRINPSTGAGTLIGPTGIVGQQDDRGVPALAIRSTGEMYAMDIGASSNLYLLSAKSGAATLVGATGLASPPAIVFDGHDVLNAIDAGGSLYTVNEATAAATLVGATGIAIKGLAVDPADGQLWGSDASSKIYKIDGGTAVATLVGNTGLPPCPDLAFDAGGVFYGASGGGLATNNLITIAKSTGAGTVIGPIGFPSVSGLATRLDHIVPVVLQTYSSTWREGRVEVRWRLTDIEGPLAFEIDRTEGRGYGRMDAGGITRDGADFVYRDDAIEPGRTYQYRVVVLEDGARTVLFETSVTVPRAGISFEVAPNPMVRFATVRFLLPRPSPVALRIFDAHGRLVRTVLDERRLPAGPHEQVWDGRGGDGHPVGPGVYWSELTATGFRGGRRLVVIR